MGDQGPVTELVRTGALQMAMVPVSVPEGYNRDFAIVSAPYLYDNTAQLLQAAREGVFDTLFETTKNLILRWYLCIHLEQGLFTQISRF